MNSEAFLARVFFWLRLWGRALRLHQWIKNVLIFVPLILAGGHAATDDTILAVTGFVLLCMTASATYIVNDLLDREADRNHPVKKARPFASGVLSLTQGIGAAILLAVAVAALAVRMPHDFMVMLATYTVLTLSYSLVLKRKAIVDFLMLAILFTLRIAAGMVLLPTPVSYWLLLFSFFFFLSLALVKRYAELNDLAEAKGHKVSGRVYIITDRPFIMSAGLASAFAGCLVFVIYIVNEHFPRNIYSTPQWLWAICAILVYWLVRIWFLASRGAMNQDPILFALKDRASLAMGVLTSAFVALAW
jgi:4-hydroxybenzoate polyprenyltransferase